MAKIMGFSAMERTISGVTSLAPETPMKTSAPRMAPASGPPDAARVRELRELGLVPREALAPGVNGAAAVADDYVARAEGEEHLRYRGARPRRGPFMTMRASASSLPASLSAFVRAAETTMAVPCWSSWKTGMSSASWSRRSISKQRGALMSSRLIPP